MSAAATARQPVLDRSDWELLVGLLERESRDLPLEIHRTANRETQQRLRDRLQRAEALLVRVRPLVS